MACSSSAVPALARQAVSCPHEWRKHASQAIGLVSGTHYTD